MRAFVKDYLATMTGTLADMDVAAVERLAERLLVAFDAGAQVLVAGNGGSASTASHVACDLGKVVLGADSDAHEGCSRVVCLGDNIALLTAWANDVSYEAVFAQEVKMVGRAGDLLLVLSVSGDSPNIVAAVRAARERELVTVGLLGGTGGAVRKLLDDYVGVPAADYGHVESTHLVLAHLLTAWLTKRVHDR